MKLSIQRLDILGDLLNIDNTYFDGMVEQIYPSELQLNKANSSGTEARFLDLYLTISDGFVSSKIYDKRDDFDFDIVNFPLLDYFITDRSKAMLLLWFILIVNVRPRYGCL